MNFRIILFIFFAIYMIKHKFQYDLHMFQQNSYRANRYLNWTFGKNNRKWKGTDSLLLISMIFWYLGEHKFFPIHNLTMTNTIQIRICTAKHLLVYIFISMLFLIFTEDAHKLIMSVNIIKKPLVYTNRVKRLMTTQIIVFLAILSFLFFTKQPTLIVCISVFALSFFSYILLIIANFINYPIEKSINNYYINDAKKILAENPNRLIIGITGSYGKTSTKKILSQIVSSEKIVLATPESYNTLMGVVRTIRESLRPIHEVFIVEMGAKQLGDIKEICDLVKPHIGIITSIGKQHLETFKSLDNIKKTKNELFMNLRENGTAILNLSDENIMSLPRRADVKYIGFKNVISENSAYVSKTQNPPHNDLSNTKEIDKTIIYKSENIKITNGGTIFDFIIPINDHNFTTKHNNTSNNNAITNPNNNKENKITITTKLLGVHNVQNLLSALTTADTLGINIYKSLPIISSIKPIEHRLSIRRGAYGETIIDDAFNSNPVGSKNALKVLKIIDGKNKYIITPGMIELGSEMDSYNRKFGQYMADVCNFVVLVGKSQTKSIAQGLEDKNYPAENIYIANSFIEGYEYLKNITSPSDVILIENDLPDSFNN